MFKLFCATALCLISICQSQYSSQTFPNPRIDPLNCRMTVPGPLCDPSGLIPQNERIALVKRINQLLAEVAPIGNSSPACDAFPGRKLEIIIAVIEKIGTIPTIPVDIERFTNSLKSRYQNFKDVSTCDNTIVIVNSKADRQVYTVAGRDVRLTKDVLKNAFVSNIHHFKDGSYSKGLEGMIDFLVTAYKLVHGSGTPETFSVKENSKPEAVIPFTVNGVQTTNEINHGNQEEIDKFSGANVVSPPVAPPSSGSENSVFLNKFEKAENESDQLWVDIMQQAMARCGSNHDKLSAYVQSIVDEAMALSLRLLSDPRYTAIEEAVQSGDGSEEARARVWHEAKIEFVDEIYKKYINLIKNGSVEKKCPAKGQILRSVSKHWN